MGTKVSNIIHGLDCPNWDPVDETPTDLYAIFWGVLKGDAPGAIQPPNDHVFKLTQDDVLPCLWFYRDVTSYWRVFFRMKWGETWLALEDASGHVHYYFLYAEDIQPLSEYELFPNSQQTPVGNYGYNGYGMLFWLDDIQTHIIAFGFEHVDDLMLEFFHVSETEFVIKLCSRILHVNVSFKLTR